MKRKRSFVQPQRKHRAAPARGGSASDRPVGNEGNMYGDHDLPLTISGEDISLSVERDGKYFVYQRTCLGEKEEKILLASGGKVLLNPVEPLNLPDELTPYLMVKLKKPMMVSPRAEETVHVTFPVEIAAYVSGKKDVQLIDVFSLVPQKFTLYGEPNNGVICKRWESGVFSEIPEPDPLREGVMRLRIRNESPDWIEVKRAVFNAYGMKMYYSDRLVAMKAKMTLKAESVAETEFTDAPVEKGMKKALELYTVKKLSVTGTRFLMELGL